MLSHSTAAAAAAAKVWHLSFRKTKSFDKTKSVVEVVKAVCLLACLVGFPSVVPALIFGMRLSFAIESGLG